jgi:hypothetical protein
MQYVRRPVKVQHIDDLSIRSVARLPDHQSFSLSNDLRVWSPRLVRQELRVGRQHAMIGDMPSIPFVPAVSHYE